MPDKKTSLEDEASLPLDGSELVRIVQTSTSTAGLVNRRCTTQDIADLASSSRTPNTQQVASAATVTPTFDDDIVDITAQAQGLTLANPTLGGQLAAIPNLGMAVRIKDNGTARTISYGTQYRAVGVTLPTSTVLGKTLYLGMIYNANATKWDVIAVAQEA